MLRPFENSLLFPSCHPAVNLSPLLGIRMAPREFLAVLDPPREKTAGGILLPNMGDGWTDRHESYREEAENAWEFYKVEAEHAMKESEKDPMSLDKRRQAIMLCELGVAAYQAMMDYQDIKSAGAAMNLRSDAYTIASAGAGVPFMAGDRVIIAPYAPWRFKEMLGVPDVCVVGVDDPWEDIVTHVWNPLHKRWELVSNWVAVKMDVLSRQIKTGWRTFNNWGTVMDVGPDSQLLHGQKVVTHSDRTRLRPDNSKWFVPKFSPYDGEGIVFVRECDSSGERRILAVS